MHAHADAKEDSAINVMASIKPCAPWRVTAIRVMENFRLKVSFVDGTEGLVDMSRLVQSPDAGVFSALRDVKVFQQARVELGAVTWPGEIDLAPDAMYDAIKKHGEWVPA